MSEQVVNASDVEMVPHSRINPAPYNPRVALEPGMEEYEQLRSSLKRWGMVEPLVVNRRNDVLVSGHQRMRVLIDLGMDELPVVWVDLDVDAEKRLNLALNRVKGKWDNVKLVELLRDVSSLATDDRRDEVIFASGFNPAEVEQMLSSAELNRALDALGELTQTDDERRAAAKRAAIEAVREDSGGNEVNASDLEGAIRDWFNLVFPVSRDERNEVMAALKSVQLERGAGSPSAALLVLCKEWAKASASAGTRDAEVG